MADLFTELLMRAAGAAPERGPASWLKQAQPEPDYGDMMPRPFKMGDKPISGDDMVASTNYGPWGHPNNYERGITRDEDRKFWSSNREAITRANKDITSDPHEKMQLEKLLYKLGHIGTK